MGKNVNIPQSALTRSPYPGQHHLASQSATEKKCEKNASFLKKLN